MSKHVAIYLRVSSKSQDTKSQEPDLSQWAIGQRNGPVVWYTDKFSGKTMQRPKWLQLEAAIRSGKVSTLVVWRLDRLGRTAKGLTALFELLQERGVNLVSIREGIDLSTPAGRMMANVLASVAQYETEVRRERVMAGQAVARANGKTWGGSKPGVRKKVTDTQANAVRQLHAAGMAKSAIAKTVGLSRPTVLGLLRDVGGVA